MERYDFAKKMERYGIKCELFEWFKSYLSK